MTTEAEGGCLCGAVRYAVDPADAVVDYCHCVTCRRASGAMAVAWMQVPPVAFRWTDGEPAAYRASRDAQRYFCRACGSPLAMADDQGLSVGVLVGSLDDPEPFPPTAHGYERSRISWVALCDGLPRHDQAPPYDLPPATTV